MALGHIDNPGTSIKTATGSAFTLSGHELDKMTNQRLHLLLQNNQLMRALS